jgi:molybdopterin-containing oxidoreductase family iron-sulfur binding subunit
VNLPTGSVLEVVFGLDNKVYDGRYANNAWLQELPDPISKITWDNAALMNPVTARALGVRFTSAAEATDGDRHEEDSNIPSTLEGGLSVDMITVTVGGRSIELPAFVVPGVAENVIAIPLGYGRGFGTVARGAGFRAEAIRSSENPWFAQDVTVARASGTYAIATTQDHGSMEGRPLFREATWTEYQQNHDFVQEPELMPSSKLFSLWDVEHLAPADDHGAHGDDHGGGHGDDHGDGHGTAAAGRQPGDQYWETDPHQWGMSIDLSTCIGCNACTAACNAENNISVVGKERVLEGREMHWIRLDRYFAGEPSNPEAKMQPVACMHCENAPCEQVCPVAATTHGPQGTNDMAYNRCIGTRYCANNCPYKVRRFNYFNFSRENDERNPLWRLQRNPDVTVRFRGVMEKCTYCVQRINGALINAKVNTPDGMVADGTIVTACEQACPTGAIVFGNIADPDSRVSKLRARDRQYALLSWVNSHPRTTYLAKISNPNPELV